MYLLVGGIFLYRVNMYWSRGIPPYYANSRAIAPWRGAENMIATILWLIVVTMLIRLLAEKRRLLSNVVVE